MRIISGEFKGRKLYPPSNIKVRPTTDLAREALFNILRHRLDLESIEALDLFAGLGSISLELVSRGAKEVTSVEINGRCIDFIKDSCEKLEIKNLHVIKADVFRFLGKSQLDFDFVFADPPYDMDNFELVVNLVLKSFLRPGGIFVMEHSKSNSFEDHEYFIETKKYGKVIFSIFQIPYK